MPQPAIGIDLGASHVKFVQVDADDGRVLTHGTFHTEDGPSMPWAERIRRQIVMLTHTHECRHLGIAAPGLAARDGRSVAWMQGRLSEVQGLDWTDLVKWPRKVPVMNDAHAALLAEAKVGAAKGARDAVMLTLGTGVGGAILADGKLLRGHLGRAGHLGHISLDPRGDRDIVGTPGSLEYLVGEYNLAFRSGGRFATTRELLAAAEGGRGDADASRLWQATIDALAAGITSIINAIDPEVVILGGGIAAAGEALFVPLRKAMDRVEWRPFGAGVRIVPAALGDLAGAIGAAYNAVQEEGA